MVQTAVSNYYEGASSSSCRIDEFFENRIGNQMSAAPQFERIHNVVEPDSSVVAVFEALQKLDFAALLSSFGPRTLPLSWFVKVSLADLVPDAILQGLVPRILAQTSVPQRWRPRYTLEKLCEYDILILCHSAKHEEICKPIIQAGGQSLVQRFSTGFQRPLYNDTGAFHRDDLTVDLAQPSFPRELSGLEGHFTRILVPCSPDAYIEEAAANVSKLLAENGQFIVIPHRPLNFEKLAEVGLAMFKESKSELIELNPKKMPNSDIISHEATYGPVDVPHGVPQTWQWMNWSGYIKFKKKGVKLKEDNRYTKSDVAGRATCARERDDRT